MQKNKHSILSYMFLIGASILLMLLFAFNTSPLIEYIGVDSGMYLVMGKAMAHGTTLYSDLFDHKGPIIFIINMLGQLFIDGTFGVWLTELFLIIISSIMIYKIAERHIGNTLSLSVPMIYIWVTTTLFNGGNYTEEYSNFFCVTSLYIFDKWNRDKKLTAKMSYLLGLCFTLVFFMRPNNVALIVAIILFIGIYMLKKDRAAIRSTFIFGSLGIVTVTLPLMIYHIFTGTLYDMFYATILHNIKYCQVGSESLRFIPTGNSQQLLCFFIAFGINLIAMCTCYSGNDTKMGNFILLSSTVLTVAILIGKRSFIYYWTLLAPLTAYSAIFIIKYGIKIKRKSMSVIALTLIFAFMCANSFGGTGITEKKDFITEYTISTHEMYDVIPTEEESDCFAYNMPSMFLYEVNLNTPCKYFTMQTWMSETNPDIAKYCIGYVNENKPKWILSYFDKNTATDSELAEMIRTDYTEVFRNDCGYLYRRVDSLQ